MPQELSQNAERNALERNEKEMQLLQELFPPETLEWMAFRFVQLSPVMVLFGFLGHLLDKDDKRFREKEKESQRREKLSKYYGGKKNGKRGGS
jgi:hypothetical protein